MYASRKEALRESIERRFEQEAEERGFGPQDRIPWFASQLDEYIDRWLGFCALPDLTMSSLVHGDLFSTVEAGSEILDEELRKSDVAEPAWRLWEGYLGQLRKLRTTDVKQDAERLGATFSEIYSFLTHGERPAAS